MHYIKNILILIKKVKNFIIYKKNMINLKDFLIKNFIDPLFSDIEDTFVKVYNIGLAKNIILKTKKSEEDRFKFLKDLEHESILELINRSKVGKWTEFEQQLFNSLNITLDDLNRLHVLACHIIVTKSNSTSLSYGNLIITDRIKINLFSEGSYCLIKIDDAHLAHASSEDSIYRLQENEICLLFINQILKLVHSLKNFIADSYYEDLPKYQILKLVHSLKNFIADSYYEDLPKSLEESEIQEIQTYIKEKISFIDKVFKEKDFYLYLDIYKQEEKIKNYIKNTISHLEGSEEFNKELTEKIDELNKLPYEAKDNLIYNYLRLFVEKQVNNKHLEKGNVQTKLDACSIELGVNDKCKD